MIVSLEMLAYGLLYKELNAATNKLLNIEMLFQVNLFSSTPSCISIGELKIILCYKVNCGTSFLKNTRLEANKINVKF